MAAELLDLYARASGWTLDKVRGAKDKLDSPTPCDDWDVRTLLNHMLQTQRYFIAAGRGESGTPPSATPPDVLSDDPVSDFAEGRDELLAVFAEPGVQDQTGPALGIAFADQLLHGWDLARATSQDATMPPECAEIAYDTIHGRFTDEERVGVFKPELAAAPDSGPQEKLLAYVGRAA
jgi:uncharacterized protein (TIGR03086 family)